MLMGRGRPCPHEREARTGLSVLRTLCGQGCPRSMNAPLTAAAFEKWFSIC